MYTPPASPRHGSRRRPRAACTQRRAQHRDLTAAMAREGRTSPVRAAVSSAPGDAPLPPGSTGCDALGELEPHATLPVLSAQQ